METAPALALVLLGNLLLSLGMVLQKRHVGWLGRRRGEAGGRDAALWGLGFLLMNFQPAFNYLGLLGLPASLVAAAAGSNVAFTALLSRPLLGEALGGRRLVGTAALLGAIGLAGLRAGGARGGSFSEPAFWVLFGLPAAGAALGTALRARLPARLRPGLLGGLAGALGGTMVLSLGALSLGGGPGIGWLGSPYLYAYLFGGAASFGLLQLAYRSGAMGETAPAFYGLQVLWPALSAYAVFGLALDPLQLLALGLIALAVAFVSLG